MHNPLKNLTRTKLAIGFSVVISGLLSGVTIGRQHGPFKQNKACAGDRECEPTCSKNEDCHSMCKCCIQKGRSTGKCIQKCTKCDTNGPIASWLDQMLSIPTAAADCRPVNACEDDSDCLMPGSRCVSTPCGNRCQGK